MATEKTFQPFVAVIYFPIEFETISVVDKQRRRKKKKKTYFSEVEVFDAGFPGKHARILGFVVVGVAERPRGIIPSPVIVLAAIDGARETRVVDALLHRCRRQRTVVVHPRVLFPGDGGGSGDAGGADGVSVASTLFAVAATHVSTTRQISYTCHQVRPGNNCGIDDLQSRFLPRNRVNTY